MTFSRNLLEIMFSSRVTPPYTTIAVNSFRGSSNSVTISAAIELNGNSRDIIEKIELGGLLVVNKL